ncbi:MAG: primase [Myxococcales bacterium]|nr:primase [Myxococcales bacterium]
MTIWIDFVELRAKVSLEDVLIKMFNLGGKLKRHGSKLTGPCPIHNGTGPRSFSADLDKNVWYCHSRCKGGNQIDLVVKMDNVSVREAALKLHAFFGLDAGAPPPLVPVPASPPATAPPPQVAAPPQTKTSEAPINPPLAVRLALDPTHPHLLKERGLKEETAKHFDVGYCARGILRGMIAIRINDVDGELVAYAGRRLKWADIRESGKYKLPGGFRKDFVLFHLDRAKAVAREQGLILVEGYFTVLKLYELGFENVVASMGCSLSEPQAELLAQHAGEYGVTVLYDGGEAGRSGASAARDVLKKLGVRTRVIWLPDKVQADAVPGRALRWALRGAKELDLEELRFSMREKPTDTTT